MTRVPYWHVDAFADRPFAGNQAAVMPFGAWPRDAVLLAIGEENNFAETAFVVPDASGETDFELRWFTPRVEIRLRGHATLAAGHVLLGQDPARQAVRFRTRQAGVLDMLLNLAAQGSGADTAEAATSNEPDRTQDIADMDLQDLLAAFSDDDAG